MLVPVMFSILSRQKLSFELREHSICCFRDGRVILEPASPFIGVSLCVKPNSNFVSQTRLTILLLLY